MSSEEKSPKETPLSANKEDTEMKDLSKDETIPPEQPEEPVPISNLNSDGKDLTVTLDNLNIPVATTETRSREPQFTIKQDIPEQEKVELRKDPSAPEHAPCYSADRSYCHKCHYVQPPLPVNVAFEQICGERGLDMNRCRQAGYDLRANYDGACPQITAHLKNPVTLRTGIKVTCSHNGEGRVVTRENPKPARRVSVTPITSRDSSRESHRGRPEKRKTPTKETCRPESRNRHRHDDHSSDGRSRQSRRPSTTRKEYTVPREEARGQPPAKAHHRPPPDQRRQDCIKFLGDLIPATARFLMDEDNANHTMELIKKNLNLVGFALFYQDTITDTCRQMETHPFERKPTIRDSCKEPENVKDLIMETWTAMASKIGKDGELVKILEQFGPADSPIGQEGRTSDKPEQLPEPKPVHPEAQEAQQPFGHLPMNPPTVGEWANSMAVWRQQCDILENMAGHVHEYPKYLNRPEIPVYKDMEHLRHLKTNTLEAPIIRAPEYRGLPRHKWQKKAFTWDDLTFGGYYTDIWSCHRRQINLDYSSYMNDANRPMDFHSAEDYEASLCQRRYLKREIQEHDGCVHEPNLIQGKTFPPEAFIHVVFNPEMQLHRGITPNMYASLGGPLLGYENPKKFWRTVNYLCLKTDSRPMEIFWTLFYLRMNGNTLDLLVYMVGRHLPARELEAFLQQGHACKIHLPNKENICPLHLQWQMNHAKMACTWDLPYSQRLHLFNKYKICSGAQPYGVQSQLCISSHEYNKCKYANGKGGLKICSYCGCLHMRPWCALNANSDGVYDLTIVNSEGVRVPPRLPFVV